MQSFNVSFETGHIKEGDSKEGVNSKLLKGQFGKKTQLVGAFQLNPVVMGPSTCSLAKGACDWFLQSNLLFSTALPW